MKWIAAGIFIFVAMPGGARADIPSPRERDQGYRQAEEPKSYGQIVAGVALAAALGIGGTLAIRHLRDQSDKAKTNESLPVPAAAENK